MERKISLIPNEDGDGRWYWLVFEYSGKNGWHNIGSGLEKSYEEAAMKAKERYGAL